MRVGGLQKRTGVRETTLGRGLWRHRSLPGRNLRIMLSSYVAEIQRFTAEGRSGLSPDRLERTERFRGKCARIGQKCVGVSPDLARREIARTPVNTGRKRETLLRRSSPTERCCDNKNGGGGGNRTRVRKCLSGGSYVRSLSFVDSPGGTASGALSRFARGKPTLPDVPSAVPAQGPLVVVHVR